ncbi:hypothetical protein D3C85_1712760 [compost metagenome]
MEDTLANSAFGTATEQYAVGQNHRAFAGVLERGKDVQQEGVVTILLGRDAEGESLKLIFSRIEAVAPGFG